MNDEQKQASPDVKPDTPPAAWDQKALSLAENAYQRSNAHAFRDRGFHVSVMQTAILKGMRFAAPQPPALGGEAETLAYLVRDSRDGQYSAHRCDPRGWAHGYQIKELIDRAHLAPLQAELTRMNQQFDELSAAVGFSKDRCEQTGDSPLDCAEQLKAEIDRLATENTALRAAGELCAGAIPRLDSARQERDQLKADLAERWEQIAELNSEAVQLKARNAELEKNHRRYEWIRSQGTKWSELSPALFERVNDECNPPYMALKFGEELDSAIDASISRAALSKPAGSESV